MILNWFSKNVWFLFQTIFHLGIHQYHPTARIPIGTPATVWILGVIPQSTVILVQYPQHFRRKTHTCRILLHCGNRRRRSICLQEAPRLVSKVLKRWVKFIHYWDIHDLLNHSPKLKNRSDCLDISLFIIWYSFFFL